MLYDTLYFGKDIVIALMLFSILITFRRMKALELELEREKYKRSMPLINMELDRHDNPAIYLINESYCYAKNIRINDLDLTLDYGFKKHLTLKFLPVETLKPGAKVQLAYKAYDRDYEITGKDSVNILHYFSNFPTEIKIRYKNIEGSPFAATICSNNNQYYIKEITPL